MPAGNRTLLSPQYRREAYLTAGEGASLQWSFEETRLFQIISTPRQSMVILFLVCFPSLIIPWDLTATIPGQKSCPPMLTAPLSL